MATSQSQTVLRWLLPILTLAWVGFLFWVSTYARGPLPPPSASAGFPNLLITPALHLGAYGLLASLLVLSIWTAWPRMARLPASLTAAFVAASVYGAALELYQTSLSSRAGSWGDAAANAAGAAIALAVLVAVRRRRASAARP